MIDQIWNTYDIDNSGALDKHETKKFLKEKFARFRNFPDEVFD